MTRVRKSPTILKPMIDENMALQFATAASPSLSAANRTEPKPAGQPSPKSRPSGATGKNVRQISLTIKRDLYDRIAKDAARKDRTVEEHLIKHLNKRYGK